MKSVCLSVLLVVLPIQVTGFEGSLQIHPYIDTNVFELSENASSSFGLKISGRANHSYETQSLRLFGEINAQGYLDGLYPDESKFIVATELIGRYRLGQKTNLIAGMSHFQKSFERAGYTYVRSDYRAGIVQRVTKHLELRTNAEMQLYRIRRTEYYHFRENTLRLTGRYRWDSGVSAEIGGRVFSLNSSDYPTFGQSVDTTLVVLDDYQSDRGYEMIFRAQYTGRIIPGIEGAYKESRSNSIVGEYRQTFIGGFISGRISRTTFYHVAVRVIDKTYAHSGIKGQTGYRDPEQPAQNRLYCRIEQQVNQNVSAFAQVSYLKNETLVNRVYFSKTFLEVGVKFTID